MPSTLTIVVGLVVVATLALFIALGKMFRKAVECNTPPLAKYVRRASNNTAVYVRL